MPDQAFHKFIQKHAEIVDHSAWAVAVSGGPDSIALAHIAIEYARQHSIQLHLLTVDHGLRTDARAEAESISAWVNALGCEHITHQILTWEGNKPDAAIMEIARKKRYELMAEYCRTHKIYYLFVAHHQGDQAETFLIRLSKGSGLEGLSAMASLRHYNDNLIVVRPLLEQSKEALIEYCQVNKLSFVEDPSNENKNYMRPRLRASMEVLEAEGLSKKRLSLTAKRMARARSALEDITEEVFQRCLLECEENFISFDFLTLQKQPEEIGLRVLRQALEQMRPEAEYHVRMEKCEELFEALWFSPASFKPRTLGGCIFALKEKGASLFIEKEKG